MRRFAEAWPCGAKRVLIVDDALIMRNAYQGNRRRSGLAGCRRSQRRRRSRGPCISRNKPDLVTLDIVMPKLDGVAALKQIIQDDPQARVVMVSAVNQKEKLAECIQAGAIDFIVKPFERAALRAFFEKYLAAESQDKEPRR